MAAATLLPPFLPLLQIQGTPASSQAAMIRSFAGTTFTNPTGTAMMSSGRNPFRSSSSSASKAVGALPTAKMSGYLCFLCQTAFISFPASGFIFPQSGADVSPFPSGISGRNASRKAFFTAAADRVVPSLRAVSAISGSAI